MTRAKLKPRKSKYKKPKLGYMPMLRDRVVTPDGYHGPVIAHTRVDGVHGATVSRENYEGKPPAHMKWYRVSELEPKEGRADARGVVHREPAKPAKPTRTPTFDVVNTVNTRLNSEYDFAIHKHGCPDAAKAKRLGADVYAHYETTPEEVQEAEVQDLADGGFGRESAEQFNFRVFPCSIPAAPTQKSGDLQGRINSLQRKRKRATIARRSTNQPTTSPTRRTKMATATKTRKGRTKAKAEPEATSNGNRRTHEDILELVPEIVRKLKAGTTMTDIRAEYGAGPVIRKALTEKGYNTKGEKVEVEDITDLKGKALAKAVAALREDGKAWYYIELAADMSADDLKELLEENGYEELASGRVVKEEDEEEKPAPKKRGRAKAAAAEEEDEPEAKPARKRGRRRANP